MVATVLDKLAALIGRDALSRIKQIRTFEKQMNDTEIKLKLQEMMPGMLLDAFKVRLEKAAELCVEAEVQVDEKLAACATGRRLADNVMKGMGERDLVNCKRDLLPLQGEPWQNHSKLLKQLHRTSGIAKSSVSQHDLQQEMISLRYEQVQKYYNLNPFISSFVGAMRGIDRKGKDDVKIFFLQWMKLYLDAKSRIKLPELLIRYCELQKRYRRAKNTEILLNDEETERLHEDVNQAEQDIADASFGLEHILRELGQIYEAVHESGEIACSEYKNVKQFPEVAARLLLVGSPLELLDGDASCVPITWVKAVLSELEKIIGQEKLFVISVLGVQSSGKSTLLNTMFGLRFPVSAGRCTRGAFMQLIRVARSDFPVGYIAVIDTEGLRAPELAMQKHTHDNELSTLAVGLGDITLVNNKGENTAEIKDVLQIVVHAFMRMKIVNKGLNINRACIFIHQNVPAINAKVKMLQAFHMLQEQLDSMTQEAAQSENILEIKSFSQIIQFDIDENVVHFTDLWQGNPPMAPVNRGYSEKAITVKQQLIETILSNHKSFLTVSDLALRIQDLWKGILADDFVFSFRNSLELKAYRAMECMYFSHQWELESLTTTWIQEKAEIELKKCESERSLQSTLDSLLRNLRGVVDKETDRIEQTLIEFFETSDLQDMQIKWRQRKLNDLKGDSDQCHRRFEKHLVEMKSELSVELMGGKKWKELEQALMQQAIMTADELRGEANRPTFDLTSRFDQMWKSMTAGCAPTQSSSSKDRNFEEIMQQILEDLFQSDGIILAEELRQQQLTQQLEQGFLFTSISLDDIGEGHLSYEETVPRTKHGRWEQFKGKVTSGFKKLFPKEEESRQQKARRMTVLATRTILEGIDQYLSNLCHRDTKFQESYAYEVIIMVKRGIDNFNRAEAIEEKFSVLQTFAVKLAVRASRHCVAVFTKMQDDYEQAHGSDTKLEALREKAFKVFNHTVKQSDEEVIAAELFCHQLKAIVKNTLTLAIPHRIVDEVIDRALTKFHLIQNILTDLADSNEFDNYPQYISDPRTYALKWITEYTNRKMFTKHGNSLSKYSELMTQHLDRIIEGVKRSAHHATRKVEEVPENKFHKWIATFCEEAKEIPVKPSDLDDFRGKHIENFSHLEKKLLLQVDTMRAELIESFSKQNSETIKWQGKTPYEQIIDRAWGCPAKCPFCREPCSLTDKNHYPPETHRCLQHRPVGVSGIRWIEHSEKKDELAVDTCSFSVQARVNYQSFPHEEGNEVCSKSTKHSHPCKEYRKFFPEWDIAPDPTNAASKYWSWFMTKYKQQLAERHHAKVPSIPPDWLLITKQEALEDLRQLH